MLARLCMCTWMRMFDNSSVLRQSVILAVVNSYPAQQQQARAETGPEELQQDNYRSWREEIYMTQGHVSHYMDH